MLLTTARVWRSRGGSRIGCSGSNKHTDQGISEQEDRDNGIWLRQDVLNRYVIERVWNVIGFKNSDRGSNSKRSYGKERQGKTRCI